jgi:pimeloyl-ACP methyl ester carboxylesterase
VKARRNNSPRVIQEPNRYATLDISKLKEKHKVMDRTKSLIIIILFFILLQPSTTMSLPLEKQKSSQPEIWIAFFHGLGGHPIVNVPLIENISRNFEQEGITLKYINPQLPNDVNLEEWSNNIATEIVKWAGNETQSHPWIILVGHSMGGKAGLHAAANNLKNINKYVASVITINSPIKNIGRYRPLTYFWNGVLLHLVAERFLHNHKVVALKDCRDIDTSIDGRKWLSQGNRSWLSFISAEAYPTDPACNLPLTKTSIDMYPRYMDDGLVPIDAQYTEDSTTVYYGVYWHQAMVEDPEAIHSLANTTVQYLTGDTINISRFHNAWIYNHQTIIPTNWNDVVGRDEIFLDSGHISYAADLLPPYEQVDTVGGNFTNQRSRYEVQKTSGAGSIIKNVTWMSSNPTDYRLNIAIQYLPFGKMELDWRVYGIIPSPLLRDHYEIEVLDGSSYGHSKILYAGWITNDITDLGVNIRSWAALGIINVGWKVYLKEPMQYPDMTFLYNPN